MLWKKSRMQDPNKHGIYNKQEIDMKNKILTNLRTLIYFSLLVYSLLMMLLTTDNQWFVLVTMLALNFSDELDNR